jgi:DEAD/DEAH box helicase domain-containing protein
MSNNNYYKNLISQAAKRSVESTISILGITDKGLRQHLVQELGGRKEGLGLLANPVFESMFPWEKSDSVMESLSDKMLQSSLIKAMDGAGDHKFGKDWFAFKHQITSWSTLLETQNKSLVVTSGTGSGKTECFMVPILNDLAKEYEEDYKPLVGVRALFIYPLNALINSQRERLRAWTEAYDDGLRFCLYNGNTQENKHKDQGKYPNEILTRKVMRDTPAPMLVTNATMLEYMLVRQIDEPIIQQSQGKLRWIVLDEAHSYIGSQAAEISLLLRRVMHAFGVEANNVRFVATSATIGDLGAEQKLQEYLASLAGISIDQVVVVGGKRSIPSLSKLIPQNKSLKEISNIDFGKSISSDRYKALVLSKVAVKLRSVLTNSSIPSTLTSLAKELFDSESKIQNALEWIDVCSNTSKPGPKKHKPEHDAEPFLPIRGHLFHQVLSGLWCCADKNCSAKAETPLLDNWAFGKVYSQRRNNCECGAPIYELLFCNDCNAPHLMGNDSNGSLIQLDRESVDEFSLDYESPEENESELEIPESTDTVIIAPRAHPDLTYPVSIDSERLITTPGMETYDLNVLDPNNISCALCEYTGFKRPFYRRSLLGTPFYISNTIPTLLDACQEAEKANDCPNRGRRLITFTDSRQGTARISTKIQQDSERDSIRGLVYGAAANNVSNIDEKELSEIKAKINKYQIKAEKFRGLGEDELAIDIDDMANSLIKKLGSIGEINYLSWDSAVNLLYSSQDISRWIFDYYKNLNPVLFPESGGARVLTEMLLLREFARRPKRQNSMETLGLVSVQYPVLNEITKAPDVWSKLNLTLDDWKKFLKVVLDFYIRENSIIDIPDDWVDWMGAKIYPKSVIKPDSDESSTSRVKRWTQVVPGRNNRMVRMLCIACDLNPKDPLHKDILNDVLKAAWNALTKKYHIQNEITGQSDIHQVLKNIPGSIQFHLARKEIAFQACTEAWVCPFTHRLLDSTFKNITPYLPFKANKEDIVCRKVEMSVCQVDASEYASDLERKLAIRDWASDQLDITQLRSENLWTDVSDRVIEGGRFYRAAEHSAQQPASKLDKYEALFKSGKLNVLSCSTTMEMGVDIGGISVVAMNNVPPHPANYLQRSGRAGRRGETQALSFTICKDNPHERNVYVNPLWPFTTSIDAPYITLNSERIIQRHINSLFLAYFLKEVLTVTETSLTSLHCQWFFYHEDENQAPVERMVRWLSAFKFEPIPEVLINGVNYIVKGSILSSSSIEQITNKSIAALNISKDQWLPGYLKIKEELARADTLNQTDPFRKKVEYDLKRMGEAYLLSEMASRAFLPGYGFPTGIATFDHYSVSDFKRGTYVNRSGRIDNLTRMRERPGRDMSVAIREYAPGADVILDGLVYRSAGILLNKFSPNEDYSEPQKMTVEWRCQSCGFIGNEVGSTFDDHCSECGANIDQDHIKEYIEPIGFAVDFYSSPSTDISSQMYIPVQEPWVTANESLEALFDSRLGSYRNSSQGHIFNHSSGEFGNGFSVCLRCGKAESMSIDNEFPVDVQPGKPHKKLQGKSGPESNAWCEGPDEAYAIKSNVHLGATDQTDVFELYLKYPNENSYMRHRQGEPLPWTLAVVLRQALADIHGINADEIGYTVKPSMLPDCDYPVAGIVLFDKSGGGAGFSSAAPRYLRDMFLRALVHLDCSDDCDSACQSCLMGYDTRFHIDLLDRHVGIEYINLILPFMNLPTEAMLFGDSSKYCNDSLSGEIFESSAHGFNNLRLFAGGNYSDWDINNSNLKDSCLNWRSTFDKVELVLPSVDVSALSEIHKEDLKALAHFGVSLRVLNDDIGIPVEKGSFLAQVVKDEKVISFASSAPFVNVPNSFWWELSANYLVKSIDSKKIETLDFNIDSLSLAVEQGDIEVEISSECDGQIIKFGKNFWDILAGQSDALHAAFNNSISLQKITYSDCYICTPWSLILFAEIIDGLKQLLDNNWDHPEIMLITADKKPSNGRGIYAEWKNSNDKSDVITHYFEQMDEEISVDIKKMQDIPHGRIFSLYWEDGSVSYVRLDHGVGCWSMDSRMSKWLDINAKPETQVVDIFDLLGNMKVRYSKNFPTQIFIKKR